MTAQTQVDPADTGTKRRVAGACAPKAARGAGVVVSYTPGERFNAASHEAVTRALAAGRLAALKGYGFADDYERATRGPGAFYFVPSRTMLAHEAAALGIRDEHDLFGGVVPFEFCGTKTITHPLIDQDAVAPEGWSKAFGRAVQDAVLPGYAAFCAADAVRAGVRLLADGAVRIKPALAVGGRGQSVVTTREALEAAVAEIDAQELVRCGVALEQNLTDVTTYSVGQVCVDDLVATYFGTQKLTADNGGAEVYGGSDLIVARGDFAALLELPIAAEVREAVVHARRYDEAARESFPGFFASRRNYDIVAGADANGARRCGVLEQSWRFGGASGAEIAALEAFRSDARLCAVRACCSERYGETVSPPADAIVYFSGVDEAVGYITKYTQVEPYAHV